MSPRETFEQYVVPALADCKAKPEALHRAVAALCNIDALAEEVWNATKQPAEGARKYREILSTKHIELAYAWDVHDIHKHGMLNRRNRVLPNGRRPEVLRVGGVFQKGVFQSNVFQTGRNEVVLTLQDGRRVRALQVIETCASWWDSELRQLDWA